MLPVTRQGGEFEMIAQKQPFLRPPSSGQLSGARLFKLCISNRQIPLSETHLTPAKSTSASFLIAKKSEYRVSAFFPSGTAPESWFCRSSYVFTGSSVVRAPAGSSNSAASRNVIRCKNPAITQGPEGAHS